MDYNSTQASDVCTTCFVKGDHSNYWIPSLYYQSGDSFEAVNQVGSASMYYFNEAARLGSGETMEPFPQGLRMLAGDYKKRTGSESFEDQAINYKCLDYSGTPTDSKGFPDHDCANGVRAEVTYPSCWDGQNLDSSDHKSHMSYPTVTFESGACPSSHPHHMVTLKVEFIFDTHAFADKWSGGQQPFVWSTGDPTGFGLHADYVMGWDYELLSSAVEQCDDEFGVLDNCAPFAGKLPPTSQTFANPGTCTVQDYVNEDIGGTVSKLPGCNPVDATGSDSTSCDDGASLSGSWGGGSASAVSSLVGGILPTGYSSAAASIPSAGAPAGSGSGVATPAAVPSSAAAGGYGGGGYMGASSAATAPYVPVAPSSGHAFYEVPASSAMPSSTPAAATPDTNMGSDGRRTRTVYDIQTVTEYVSGFPPGETSVPEGQWKREAMEYVHDHRHAHGRRHG